MQLTRDQQTGYNLIELRILNQRYIEILDELNYERHPFKNRFERSAYLSTRTKPCDINKIFRLRPRNQFAELCLWQ